MRKISKGRVTLSYIGPVASWVRLGKKHKAQYIEPPPFDPKNITQEQQEYIMKVAKDRKAPFEKKEKLVKKPKFPTLVQRQEAQDQGNPQHRRESRRHAGNERGRQYFF